MRVRSCEPPPHDREHADQAPNAERTQSTGHASVLHACVALSGGHAMPPCAAAVDTERVCVCEPPPHDTEHVDHAENAVTTQCTGHVTTLQARVSLRAPHATPPYAIARFTARERDWVPAAHVVEHAPQSDQADSMQSIGQDHTLQGCVSARDGHATPPLLTSVTTVRARLCEPLPQLWEHVDHRSHAETTQSTGHMSVLHD